MKHNYYTLSVWKVKPGMADQFRAAWRDMAKVFSDLPNPPFHITLLQSLDDPDLFYSFSPWESMDAIHALRRNPDTKDEIQRVVDLCVEYKMSNFHAKDEIET